MGANSEDAPFKQTPERLILPDSAAKHLQTCYVPLGSRNTNAASHACNDSAHNRPRGADNVTPRTLHGQPTRCQEDAAPSSANSRVVDSVRRPGVRSMIPKCEMECVESIMLWGRLGRPLCMSLKSVVVLLYRKVWNGFTTEG